MNIVPDLTAVAERMHDCYAALTWMSPKSVSVYRNPFPSIPNPPKKNPYHTLLSEPSRLTHALTCIFIFESFKCLPV